ncbi:MAG TPA: lipoprotein insertase outer membrane protein LolB [Geobacteraceae bacterium]|nr:lipoprotein insertase outer membrane protein LolB [Geobacteraceae bacterium]
MCYKLRGLSSSLLMLAALTLFAGCAAAPRLPLTGLIPGKEVETLQSSISVSVKTPERSMGGHGFLIFKRPDRFHLAVLSPFGLTMVDLYSDGDRFTCVIPARQTAYSGRISELPDRDGLKAWAMMRWVVERTPVAGPALERSNVNGAGVRERLYYDGQGLLERKETEQGDRVVYRDYRNVDGVAVAESIELTNSRNDTVRVVFEEPEVNRTVEEAALSPHLEGIKVLPFTEFHGF